MSIYVAMKLNLGTGSITGGNEQSYVVPYYVYTDNTDTPKQIYDKAISTDGIPLVDVNNNVLPEKLPTYGTVTSNLYVSNINIERVSESNIKAVPRYGLNYRNNASYTCWLYTVTYSCSEITFSSGTEKPWDKGEAISCTWTPKTYDRYDNRTLIPNYKEPKDSDDSKVPNYPLGQEKYTILKNTVGDDVYRNRTVYNYLLNFTYAVKHFDALWLPLYLNSMNLKDMVIAGIPIKKYHAVINDMRVSQAEYNNELYYNVDVEVEIQYQQRLTWDEGTSTGYRAYMIEGSADAIHSYLVNTLKITVPEEAPEGTTVEQVAGFVYKYTNSSTIKKYPVPIQEFTDDRTRGKVPDRRWFSKKKNYGYFEGLFKTTSSEETVTIPRKIFLTRAGNEIGDLLLYISFINPSNFDGGSVPAEFEEKLYFTGAFHDNEYVYSIKEADQEAYITDNADNIDELRSNTDLRFIRYEGTLGVDVQYYMLKQTIKHTKLQEPADPFAGQYDNMSEPAALNKHGGLYLVQGETSTLDDGNTPAMIDMYDPMLGKVKDYQHVARDWTALKFPRKGMFHTDADGIKIDMSRGSTFFS